MVYFEEKLHSARVLRGLGRNRVVALPALTAPTPDGPANGIG